MLKKLDLRNFDGDLEEILPTPQFSYDSIVEEVAAIIEEVRIKGDDALFELTQRFDGAHLDALEVSSLEVAEAKEAIGEDLRNALISALDAISQYHEHVLYKPQAYQPDKNLRIEQMIRPVKRAGIYIPGGRAIYPSSVLMSIIPAKVAGVEEIAVCVPPNSSGKIPDPVLAAIGLCGADEIYKVGGAQAIAALAYGTKSIKKVNVIAGPGNKYVALAKRMVSGSVGVSNAFAGPSEVAVIADESAKIDLVAIDLIVQAEHGPDGFTWLITTSEDISNEIEGVIETELQTQPRAIEIRSALSFGGYNLLVRDLEQAVEVANVVAPEHLELMCRDPWSLVASIENAGAVFVGEFAPAAFGDYMAGPSHVLPTFRSAKYSSGLSSLDFLRYSHAIYASKEELLKKAKDISALARVEGLFAHDSAIQKRLSY